MGLVLDKVNRRFGDTVAVDDVFIEMQSGLYGLLGSNGAGKTTLMRMICTILQPTEEAYAITMLMYLRWMPNIGIF